MLAEIKGTEVLILTFEIAHDVVGASYWSCDIIELIQIANSMGLLYYVRLVLILRRAALDIYTYPMVIVMLLF